VANRGEIAVRIIRTPRELGLDSVVVFHPVDAGSITVREAGQAVPINGSTPVAAYLDVERIVEAAVETGADAVHPGFGFLAENATSLRPSGTRGSRFVGPSPGAIRAMGDKIESKRLAQRAGIPTVPSSPRHDGPVNGSARSSGATRR
jgi:acetyl/propionyl-CoA carboxylase alpha subunit